MDFSKYEPSQEIPDTPSKCEEYLSDANAKFQMLIADSIPISQRVSTLLDTLKRNPSEPILPDPLMRCLKDLLEATHYLTTLRNRVDYLEKAKKQF